MKETVVVAMSGGVDSSAAAIILAEEGYQVVGVSMQVWDYRQHGGASGKATCCAPSDFDDARSVADYRGFPFYVFDFESSFRTEVIEPFVSSYLAGKTPNPCIECNRRVKFRELRKRAESLGASKVATGHYAQIKAKDGGRFGLFTGRDRSKDQSYFLYSLTQGELTKTLFPVGSMSKKDVRAFLAKHGLHLAAKKESQDICFVQDSAAVFVEKFAAKEPQKGKIRLADGTVVGEHNGIHRFTVGQRRGLGLSSPEPLYVLSIDAEENSIAVGGEAELQREKFAVDDVNWISGSAPAEPFTALVKMRYRHAGVLCEVTPLCSDRAEVRFLGRWSAVSPGQAAVFYSAEPDADGDSEVIGGGTIR